ncbi:glucose-6-phosphate isomerase [Candidatus Margulisiibacteriota bacterium]
MDDQQYLDLDKTSIFSKLQKKAKIRIDLKKLLTVERVKDFVVNNEPLSLSYATGLIDEELLDLFQKLADEQKLIERYQTLLAGEIVNVGEQRKVLHQKVRSKNSEFYGEQQKRISPFVEKVHNNEYQGFSGKNFDTVVQIGIGGSDLGPRALHVALERFVEVEKGKAPLKAFFIANVDPDDANFILNKVNFETTLFVVVSKSGTTQETLTNLAFVQERAKKAGMGEADFNKHFLAVTAKGSPMDDPKKYLEAFYIDDHIGGRYSATSAVGAVVLSLAFGNDVFQEILIGANTIDKAALEPNIRKNTTLLSALISVWERTFLGFPSKAIVPYCESLARFPAHLQQLDCESNGKSANCYFQPLTYQTGPMIFGEPGTNGQHSFFQKLHQGTDVIPIQFIGFSEPQILQDISFQGTTSQEKLLANLVAQMVALAKGKDDENYNKYFSGNRPSTLVFAKRLTPKTLGALLAFYENAVMFQGFIWNLNSFDQEGVQLGKVLAKKALDRTDEILNSYLDLLPGNC